MEIICPERERAQRYAYAIWGLADRFARVKGGPMTLVLMDKRFIRDVHIAPIAIGQGLIAVERWPQPLKSKSKPGIKRVYDLTQPPIAAGDVEELATLADLLLRLEPYFQTK